MGTMTPEQRAAAREAFVAYVKRTQKDWEAWQRDSLAQHWRGKAHGFRDPYVQDGYTNFLAGYVAALDVADARIAALEGAIEAYCQKGCEWTPQSTCFEGCPLYPYQKGA